MRLLTVAVIALVLVPAAAAWTPVPGPVLNIVEPSMLMTSSGTTLVSFESPNADTIWVARNHAAPKAVVTNDPIAGQTQLLQQPSGAIQLYYPNAAGVGRLQSTDDGQTWTGPFQTQSHTLAGVSGAAVAADGTPYFVQEGTGYVQISKGLNGETESNVFTRCCGYGASLAIDATGLVQVAFYSNADPDGTFLYEKLTPSLTVAGQTPLKPTAPHDDRVPLVSDRSGNTFMAWPAGYPTATGFKVVPFSGGAPAGDGVGFNGAFGGGDPHSALSVDSQDRLWAVWSAGGAVHVARSRSHGQHFGAVVSAKVPGTIYQVSAVGISTGVGSVDVIVNTGSSLIEQILQPGLSVRLTAVKKKVGKKTLVTHFAQALDDGFPVAQATFTIGGRTFKADASGRAKVPVASGKAAAAGYVAASFKVH